MFLYDDMEHNSSHILLQMYLTRSETKAKMTSHTSLDKHRGSYMSAHVLLNLLNKLGNIDKMQGLPSIILFRNKFIINSIIQEHEC